MSLTKTFAMVAHVLIAVMFVRLQWDAPFNEMLWVLYVGSAIGHAAFDKTSALVKSFKDNQAAAEKDGGGGVPRP